MKSNSNSDRYGIRMSKESDDFLLEFESNNEDFMRGFECGEIWACLADEVKELHSIIAASNAEMVIRMAEAAHYSFEARDLTSDEVTELDLGSGDWMIVIMRSHD